MAVEKITTINSSTLRIGLLVPMLLGMIAAHNWLVSPHLQSLYATQKYAAAKSNLEKKQLIINNTIELKKRELLGLQNQQQSLERSLFTSQQVGEFFDSFHEFAEQAGCTITSLDFAVEKPKALKNQSAGQFEITSETATLTVAGQYIDIIAFLDKLKFGTSKVWVTLSAISPARDDPQQLYCDLKITVCSIQN